MDFDDPKVYGDTSIFDGLVILIIVEIIPLLCQSVIIVVIVITLIKTFTLSGKAD